MTEKSQKPNLSLRNLSTEELLNVTPNTELEKQLQDRLSKILGVQAKVREEFYLQDSTLL